MTAAVQVVRSTKLCLSSEAVHIWMAVSCVLPYTWRPRSERAHPMKIELPRPPSLQNKKYRVGRSAKDPSIAGKMRVNFGQCLYLSDGERSIINISHHII